MKNIGWSRKVFQLEHGAQLRVCDARRAPNCFLLRRKLRDRITPTSQLLPIMINKFCSGDGEGRKDKGGGGGKMVCDKVVCVKDAVLKDGVCKMVCQRLCVKDVCDKVVCERPCVKDGV